MSAGALVVKVATDALRSEALALADEVFLRSRGRSGTVAGRFPAALGPDSGGEVVAALRGDALAGVAVARPFEWLGGGSRRRLGMVGLVATRPEARRSGVASAVLEHAAERLALAGAEAAVVFAARHDLYLRLGWTPSDPGVLGEADAGTGDPEHRGGGRAAPQVLVRELDAEMAHVLWRAGESRPAPGVRRRPEALLTVPPPAERVLALIAGSLEAPGGHAIVGVRGDEGYLYEIAGDEDALERLWSALTANLSRVLVNERRGSPAQTWLEGHREVAFGPQQLALWRSLGAGAAAGDWPHVPWIDRI